MLLWAWFGFLVLGILSFTSTPLVCWLFTTALQQTVFTYSDFNFSTDSIYAHCTVIDYYLPVELMLITGFIQVHPQSYQRSFSCHIFDRKPDFVNIWFPLTQLMNYFWALRINWHSKFQRPKFKKWGVNMAWHTTLAATIVHLYQETFSVCPGLQD